MTIVLFCFSVYMVLFIVHGYGLVGILSMAYALQSLTYYIRDRHENAFYENILHLDVFMLRSRKQLQVTCIVQQVKCKHVPVI